MGFSSLKTPNEYPSDIYMEAHHPIPLPFRPAPSNAWLKKGAVFLLPGRAGTIRTINLLPLLIIV